MQPSTDTVVERYTAVWNEPDPDARRAVIAELWAADAVEFTDTREHRGHAAIERRVAEAYEKLVKPGTYLFVAGNDVASHHGALTFTTRMVPAAGGPAVWAGTIFLVRDAVGRITRDYQFTGPEAGTRAVVTDFLHRLGGADGVEDLFAETVDWRLSWPDAGHPAVPWIRPRATRADVADHFRTLKSAHIDDGAVAAAPEILVQDRNAIVLGEIRRTVRATGRPYVARFALRLTVENGLITRYHVYEDSLSVAQAMAPSATAPVSARRGSPAEN